jgi:zeaxanthin glucosyltransferase
MIAVAQRLERRGHQITLFSCQGDISERCRRAGLAARCATDLPRTGGFAAAVPQSAQLAERMANPAWLKRWLWTVLVDPVARQVSALRTLIQRERPDLVATDAMAYAGAVAATLEAVPWAALSTGLQSFAPPGQDAPNAAAFEQLAGPRAAQLSTLGAALAFRASDCVSPALNLVFASPRLWHGSEPPAGVVAVGGALRLDDGDADPSFPWHRMPADRALVYVAFGSQISPPLDVYEALAGALSADEAFLVMAVKDLVDAPRIRALPAHVLAVPYAPQLALLRRASAMVNHAGTNSVMECLALGTPMIVLPLTNDQFVMARLVERSGLGRSLALPLTPVACRQALLDILSTTGALDAATPPRTHGQPAEAEDGADTAADLLLQLIR